MDKVVLKYDDVRPNVSCEYGFVLAILVVGFLYPLYKKNYKYSLIMFLLQLAVTVIFMILFGFPIGMFFSIIMVFLINILFAYNYNLFVIQDLIKEGYSPYDHESSLILIKKGVYFKLK